MKEQRLKSLENYIREKEMCRIDELCSEFNVSIATMRRDVDALLKCGLINKVYGGVKLNRKDNYLTEPFYKRAIKNIDAKQYIGSVSESLIENYDTIFLDSGTTTFFITKYIKSKNVTVITTSLNVINECRDLENINLISIGGNFNKMTNSFVGEFADKNLSTYHISKAFIAATGASLVSGFTNYFHEETKIKRTAIEISNSAYITIDSSKWGKVSLLTFSELSKVNGVITEKEPPSEFLSYFKKNKINIYF